MGTLAEASSCSLIAVFLAFFAIFFATCVYNLHTIICVYGHIALTAHTRVTRTCAMCMRQIYTSGIFSIRTAFLSINHSACDRIYEYIRHPKYLPVAPNSPIFKQFATSPEPHRRSVRFFVSVIKMFRAHANTNRKLFIIFDSGQ